MTTDKRALTDEREASRDRMRRSWAQWEPGGQGFGGGGGIMGAGGGGGGLEKSRKWERAGA